MVPEDQRQRSVPVGGHLIADEGQFAAIQPGIIAVRPANAEGSPGIVSRVNAEKMIFPPGAESVSRRPGSYRWPFPEPSWPGSN